MAKRPTWVLTASCPDRTGIVAAVSTFLAERACFIVESAHHREPGTDRFFMRTVFHPADDDNDRARFSDSLGHVAARFDMRLAVHDAGHRQRLLLLVSKTGHCLNDILYRARMGHLKVDVVGIVSNHTTFAPEAGFHDVPFHHLPVDAGNRQAQQEAIWRLVQEQEVDLVVLARYMQVLSPWLCERLAGRCINIHHSFLPGFKGARPYHQAYEAGVKLIGATAHYVSADLDEGPIIEQAVERVHHRQSARDLAAVGRDIESMVLARAIRYHVEHRVLVNGRRTVVL